MTKEELARDILVAMIENRPQTIHSMVPGESITGYTKANVPAEVCMAVIAAQAAKSLLVEVGK